MWQGLIMLPIAFFHIFLKSFQQLNVVHKKYWWVLPVSYCLAASEAFLWVWIVNEGLGWGVFWMGTGSGIGCVTGMWLHKRVTGK